jgi:hypothetical protein
MIDYGAFYGLMGVAKEDEIQGSLLCGGKSAAFGQDDVCGWLYRIDATRQRQKQIPTG